MQVNMVDWQLQDMVRKQLLDMAMNMVVVVSMSAAKFNLDMRMCAV